MSKIEVNWYGDNQEITFSPGEGDLRCVNASGTIERYMNGTWYYMGDLEQLFTKVLQAETQISELQSFMWRQDQKDKEALQIHSLEEQFDDLKEAGEYLRQLEQTLRNARKAYTNMTEATQEKLKTFKTLDVPYPE